MASELEGGGPFAPRHKQALRDAGRQGYRLLKQEGGGFVLVDAATNANKFETEAKTRDESLAEIQDYLTKGTK